MATSGGMGAGHVDIEERDLFLGRKRARRSARFAPLFHEWFANKTDQTSTVRAERRSGRGERQLVALALTGSSKDTFSSSERTSPKGNAKAKAKSD